MTARAEYTYDLHEHGETYVIIRDDKFVDPQAVCERLNSRELEQVLRDWLPLLKVIVDYAPKPLDDRAFKIFEEMEALVDDR